MIQMTNIEAVVDMNSKVLKNDMEKKYDLKSEYTHYGNHCVKLFNNILKNIKSFYLPKVSFQKKRRSVQNHDRPSLVHFNIRNGSARRTRLFHLLPIKKIHFNLVENIIPDIAGIYLGHLSLDVW